MNLPDRISYSAWQVYRNNCQWRWKLDNVDGFKKNIFGIHLDFGTSIHHAIEHFKRRTDPVNLETAQKLFEDKFRELYKENSSKYKDKEKELDPEDFIKSGKRVLVDFENYEFMKEAEVLYNEHELILPIDRTDEVKMNFKGYIDMVVKTKDKKGKTILYILDFKSCSWGWTKEKKQDEELKYQLFLYKHFLCKKFNLNPKEVRTAFLLLKKKPAGKSTAVELLPVSAGPISLQRTMDNLNSDITDMNERIKHNSFVKNRNNCVTKYGDKCPYYNSEQCPGEK